MNLRLWILAIGNTMIKSILFPWLFSKAVRNIKIRREIEPLVGYNLSLLTGIACFGLSLWIGSKLLLPVTILSTLTVPTVFFMLFTGLFLIISRNKAITQVMGYLVLENGIYTFGIAFAGAAPLFVELGVFLDMLVAVFAMGIMINQIDRQFDSLHVGRLMQLKD
jgi:hydrogenase-4 component E